MACQIQIIRRIMAKSRWSNNKILSESTTKPRAICKNAKSVDLDNRQGHIQADTSLDCQSFRKIWTIEFRQARWKSYKCENLELDSLTQMMVERAVNGTNRSCCANDWFNSRLCIGYTLDGADELCSRRQSVT